MNVILEQTNSIGKTFVEFAGPMLVQSSVLIVILLLVDLALRKKVRAVFRYCIWMLVLAKLVLPSSLSSPLSFGYLFGDSLENVTVSSTRTTAETMEMSLPMEMLGEGEAKSVEAISAAPIVTPTTEGIEPVEVEAAGSPVASMRQVTWQGVVFLVWVVVVGAMVLLLLQRALFVRGLVAQAKNANSLMNDAFRYCCMQMGMKSEVGLKVSANATSPAVCGLFRPVILVPQNLGPSLGSSGLRTVLLHELAHIKRHDLWVNLVQTILQIIYFYNPLLWLANAVIRRVREQAVDETVQVAMGERAQQYPETLVNVAKLAFKRPALSLRLIGVVESKSALKGRIKHLLNRPIPKSAKLGILGLIVVLIIGAILLPMAKAENLTHHARKAMELADQEARRLNHEYIGTEHILLALVKDGRGVAATILKNLDVDTKQVHPEVDRLIKRGSNRVEKKKLPQTPRAKKAMDYAREEAGLLNHDCVSTEHILLGLLREKDGVGGQVLINLGVKYEDVRREVIKLVGRGPIKGGHPTLVISGVVKDAATGLPIAGVSVGDDGYAGGIRSTVTDSNGSYSYLTWPEHHSIKAEAGGYTSQSKSLYSGHFTFNKEMVEEVFDFELVPHHSGFIATLSNGVTVELVGVCEYPSEGKQWWRPDGTVLPEDIHVKKGSTVIARGKAFAFAVKVKGPEDMTFTWGEIEGARGTADLEVVDSKGQAIGDMEALKVHIDEARTTASMRIGVATGDWMTITEHNGKDIMSMGFPQGGIAFSQAYESDKGVKITVSDDLGKIDHRIAAVDGEGNILQAVSGPWVGAGKIRQTTANFEGLSFEQIKEFQFQTRPYEWVEFRNVSLRPGVKTDVEVETGPTKTISDSASKTKTVAGNFDVAAEDFKISPYVAGGLYTATVAIRNKGTETAAAFRLNFYRGDPADNLNQHGKPHTGSHGAGPIKPGNLWNECSSPFALGEGLNEISVVLDIDNTIAEADEANNTAKMKILVKDGRIVEESVSYSPQKGIGRSEVKTDVEVVGEGDKYNLMARGGKGRVEALDPNAANLIRRYLRALEKSDWKTALSMCSISVMDKAQQYPTPESFFNTVVPVKEILNKLRDPQIGSWQPPPKYFAYIFDVRISQLDMPRDVSWVWKARKLEGRANWEIDFPAIPFKTWLANEKRVIIRVAQEHEQRIKELAPRLKGVRTLLTAKKEEFVVGEPIYFRLRLINQGDSILSYDCQQVAVNNSMTIEGPDGKEVKYTAEYFQTLGSLVLFKPGETKTLFDQFDITEQYDIRQPGQYRVQFNGNGLRIGVGKEDTSDLNDPTSVEYYPGILPSNVVIITIYSGIKQETLDVGKDGVEGEKAVSQTNTEDNPAGQVEGERH